MSLDIQNTCDEENETLFTKSSSKSVEGDSGDDGKKIYKSSGVYDNEDEEVMRITSSSARGRGKSILKQVKCPPSVNQKSIEMFTKKWLPSLEKYAFDYTGLGDMVGVTKKKKQAKTTIGSSGFISTGEKCDIQSDLSCIGQDKYLYVRNYPLGYIPNCNQNSDNHLKLIGGTGLIGNIQEDIYNLPVSDTISGIMNQGPLVSNKCMRVRLPVGDSFLKSSNRKLSPDEKIEGKSMKDEDIDDYTNQSGWWVEERCVPEQPTTSVKYGDEVFNVPFSKNNCVEMFQNRNSQNNSRQYRNKNKCDNRSMMFLLIMVILIFCIFTIYLHYF
tara:strand:- start:5120 stop:6106 length:987 start_codon:yes stop_codon:yes gene_type:complete